MAENTSVSFGNSDDKLPDIHSIGSMGGSGRGKYALPKKRDEKFFRKNGLVIPAQTW
jgi:hypothetical protein